MAACRVVVGECDIAVRQHTTKQKLLERPESPGSRPSASCSLLQHRRKTIGRLAGLKGGEMQQLLWAAEPNWQVQVLVVVR